MRCDTVPKRKVSIWLLCLRFFVAVLRNNFVCEVLNTLRARCTKNVPKVIRLNPKGFYFERKQIP